MRKDPRVYLAQILDRVGRILRYTAPGQETFLKDTMIQDAVVRNLEVIGEAAKRIDGDYRKAHPSVPCRSLTALRDVLIHQYEGVSLPEVWQVVEQHLPALRARSPALLPPLEQLEKEVAGDHDADLDD